MTACRPAEDAELMLHAYHVGVVQVQEIRRLLAGGQVLLLNLEAHFGRIRVAVSQVVDGHDGTVETATQTGHRRAQIGGELGDAALAGQVIPHERDLLDVRNALHGTQHN